MQEQARALGDPTRHQIFRYIGDAARAVGVAELTDHLGLNHNAIRQHLAKLVDAGLVWEAKAAPTGPGRPRLVYEIDPTADSRWGVEGPYERLSVMLAEVIRSGRTPVEVGRDLGRRRSITSVEPDAVVDELLAAIARDGFDPEPRARRDRLDVVLRHCPFATTAVADPDTVCALHLGLAEGMVEDVDDLSVERLEAKDPRRADCRLRFRLGR